MNVLASILGAGERYPSGEYRAGIAEDCGPEVTTIAEG